MSTLARHGAASSTALLSRILDAPELVAAVRSLPATALAALVEHVGLEDAGELLALASGEQLERVFDEDLWVGDPDQAEESFDVGRFHLWLSILAEAGDDALAARLAELPEDLLTLAVQRSVLVLDLEALGRLGLDDADADLADKALDSALHEPWEELVLVARDAEGWDATWHALTCLDRDHHDLVRRVLERCAASAEDELEAHEGLHALLTGASLLEGQVSDARDERRAERGYVSAADARAFLKLADREPAEGERDAITRAYFRRASAVPVERPRAPASAPEAEAQRRSRALMQMLGEAEVVDVPRPPAALTGGRDAAAPGLRTLLGWLWEHAPSRHAAVLEELGYLANVLLSAARAIEPLRPVEALELAVAVCDVALASEVDAGRVLAELPAEQIFLRGLRLLRTRVREGGRVDAPGLPCWLVPGAAPPGA